MKFRIINTLHTCSTVLYLMTHIHVIKRSIVLCVLCVLMFYVFYCSMHSIVLHVLLFYKFYCSIRSTVLCVLVLYVLLFYTFYCSIRSLRSVKETGSVMFSLCNIVSVIIHGVIRSGTHLFTGCVTW